MRNVKYRVEYFLVSSLLVEYSCLFCIEVSVESSAELCLDPNVSFFVNVFFFFLGAFFMAAADPHCCTAFL